ncbi:hypothetical protein AB834_04040 [PVC group bacterium (ex Bugula neritina AB1)]|nr:hypothetical protein AB834_04040 [PVC group bacterium (ex Bugula neritina AB1)]
MYKTFIAFFICMMNLCCVSLFAEKIFLANGDQISGEVCSFSDTHIDFESDLLGKISIDRKLLKVGEKYACVETKKIEEKTPWKADVSLGYKLSQGNTNETNWNGEIDLEKKYADRGELSIKWHQLQSTSDGEKKEQEWLFKIEQIKFFNDSNWFRSYKLNLDHDRFSNIDHRIVTSFGLGCQWIDTDDMSLDIRVALAWESTFFRDETEEKNDLILSPSFKWKYNILESSELTWEVNTYPSFKGGYGFRMKSDFAIVTPINDKLSIKLRFIDEYDSQPKVDALENDVKLVSSLVYHI